MASKLLAGLGIVGVLTIPLCIAVAVNPEPILSMADWESRTILYLSAVGNLGWAAVLFFAAPASRVPVAYRMLAALALVEAILFPLLPVEVWAGYIQWWTVDHVAVYRFGGSTVGALFAALLIYGALPPRPTVRPSV